MTQHELVRVALSEQLAHAVELAKQRRVRVACRSRARSQMREAADQRAEIRFGPRALRESRLDVFVRVTRRGATRPQALVRRWDAALPEPLLRQQPPARIRATR